MAEQKPMQRGRGLAPATADLCARPLDVISADHLVERRVCAVIDGLAAATTLDRREGLHVLRFLDEDLGVHLRDMTDDLFPLLRQRCTVEDSIARTLDRIGADRDEILRLLPAVRTALATCLEAGSDLSADARPLMYRFTGHVRRHLVAENAILLPIARARLTPADLVLLAARMRARRGLSPHPSDDAC